MKKILSVFTAIAAIMMATSTKAAVTYNDTVTAIYGGGNPDGGWTTAGKHGIELSLRAKNRDDGTTPNTLGVYTFPTGVAANPARAKWNWEFSINSGNKPLSTYDYYLVVDLDYSSALTGPTINALTTFSDSSYGTSSTLNGQGVEGPSLLLAPINSIVQQSQNIVFQGLNPFLDATYTYKLYAVKKGKGPNSKKLASVSIKVVVGVGGVVVPHHDNDSDDDDDDGGDDHHDADKDRDDKD
jgi:hypothetical protein